MDKINKILEKLIESTECGALEWSPRNTTFNSESRHHYHTKSVDEKTTFEIEISLTEKLDSIGYRNSLWIKNEFFTDGRKQVSSNELTKKLEDLVDQVNEYINSQVKDERTAAIATNLRNSAITLIDNNTKKLDKLKKSLEGLTRTLATITAIVAIIQAVLNLPFPFLTS